MVALGTGELCASPTAVGGAARHKHGRAPSALVNTPSERHVQRHAGIRRSAEYSTERNGTERNGTERNGTDYPIPVFPVVKTNFQIDKGDRIFV